MHPKHMKKTALCLMLLGVLLFLTACGSSLPPEKQELSKRMVKRCSNAWHKLELNADDDADPKNSSWLYKEYDDRSTLTKDLGDSANYQWLPTAGYLIMIGKVVVLFGSDDSLVGYYVDNDNNVLFKAKKSSSSDTLNMDKLLEKSTFNLFMSGQVLEAFFPTAFEEYKPGTDHGYCVLTDDQIRQIK